MRLIFKSLKIFSFSLLSCNENEFKMLWTNHRFLIMIWMLNDVEEFFIFVPVMWCCLILITLHCSAGFKKSYDEEKKTWKLKKFGVVRKLGHAFRREGRYMNLWPFKFENSEFSGIQKAARLVKPHFKTDKNHRHDASTSFWSFFKWR